MNDWNNPLGNVSETFDRDYGSTQEVVPVKHEVLAINKFSTYTHDAPDIFHLQDPLKYSYKHQFKPFQLDLGNTHFVKPHYVDPYIRKDGTLVKGYFRDGDGNTSIPRTVEQGGGYIRSNPDGNPFNNLK